jgi:glycosyltransferase involved in cell wall biosynthesis
MRHCSGIDFDPVDGLNEQEVSKRLKQAGIFLATSLGEQFGLPALEAMAAGCLVLSVPVKGGMEYLYHDKNCLIVEPSKLASTLQDITKPTRQTDRIRLRSHAVSTAFAYSRGRQQKLLRTQIAAPLQCLLS